MTFVDNKMRCVIIISHVVKIAWLVVILVCATLMGHGKNHIPISCFPRMRSLYRSPIYPKVVIVCKCWLYLAYFFQIEICEYQFISSTLYEYDVWNFLMIFTGNILTNDQTFYIESFHITSHPLSPLRLYELIYRKQY